MEFVNLQFCVNLLRPFGGSGSVSPHLGGGSDSSSSAAIAISLKTTKLKILPPRNRIFFGLKNMKQI